MPPPATTDSSALTRRAVLRRAWPIILANASVPLVGLADTAVIGNSGAVADLGAIALGSLVFNFLYWGFGFLRMGTTGFTAQAAGAGDEIEVRATLGRSLLLGLALGGGLWLFRAPLAHLAFSLLDAESDVENVATGYFAWRIWGAPASLGTFAVMGSLIGLGLSRQLLAAQLVLNGLNVLLDVWLVVKRGLGAPGVGLGTAIAEWIAFGFALGLLTLTLGQRRTQGEAFWPWPRILRRERLVRTLSANVDILLRTLFLLLGFALFTNYGARFGKATLAGNHLLLQFISFSAFFLDGYAFVAESLVGQALGAQHRASFDAAVRKTSELAVLTGLSLAVGLGLCGPRLIDLLTDLPRVREAAMQQLPWAVLYVLLSCGAFQLDGIFIGATKTRAMKNASLASFLVFLVASWVLTRAAGNTGLWWAFVVFVVARAAALGLCYPALARSVRR